MSPVTLARGRRPAAHRGGTPRRRGGMVRALASSMENAALELDTDYLLGEVLGTGGMGVIYSAIQKSLGRRVAIKIPHPELAGDPYVTRRFRAEARASSRIDHK